jgi:hypothetical protein
LTEQLPFGFSGLASKYFSSWWARGLEDWWFDFIGSERALVSLTIAERIEELGKKFQGLVPLEMPAGSAGARPWRACTLSLETDAPEWVPVDPAESVRLTPRADPPVWTDPLHASLRKANQERHDFRINRSDLERLGRKY